MSRMRRNLLWTEIISGIGSSVDSLSDWESSDSVDVCKTVWSASASVLDFTSDSKSSNSSDFGFLKIKYRHRENIPVVTARVILSFFHGIVSFGWNGWASLSVLKKRLFRNHISREKRLSYMLVTYKNRWPRSIDFWAYPSWVRSKLAKIRKVISGSIGRCHRKAVGCRVTHKTMFQRWTNGQARMNVLPVAAQKMNMKVVITWTRRGAKEMP